MLSARVVELSSTPVKGLRIARRSELVVDPRGVRGDRCFYLVDERLRAVNGKRFGALNEVVAELDQADERSDELPGADERRRRAERLTLRFPDGSSVSEEVEHGEQLQTSFHSTPRLARVVRGPFAQALSTHVGEQLRLVSAADGSSAVDRGDLGALSLVSRASLRTLAGVADRSEVDARRFRMSIVIDGVDPFEEDDWIGRELRIGSEVRLRPRGHIGRCVVTTLHPETGLHDLPTLDALRELRAGATSTEPLPFGIHAAVLSPGSIRVGDPVELG